MRRMTVAFLIAGLLGISVSSAAIGQASSPTPAASDGPAAVAWFENGPAVVEEVALSGAAVDAIRVDVEWADVPRFITAYMLTDGTIAASLPCHGSERPGDRWLSIAETFEFLPGES